MLLKIELFGGLRIRLDEGDGIDIPSHQAGALLAYLALFRSRIHTREELIDTFWPEEGLEEGRYKLRQALYGMRRLLEPLPAACQNALLTTRTTVQLDPTLLHTDATAFESTLEAAQQTNDLGERAHLYGEALTLYRGGLLPGFYQNCFLAEQQRFAERHRDALHALAITLEKLGEFGKAQSYLQQLLALDPLREEVHCDLMRLYAVSGQPSAVLRQYQDLERTLKEELGEEPSPTTRAFMEALRQSGRAAATANGQVVAAPSASPPARAASDSSGPIAASPTPLAAVASPALSTTTSPTLHRKRGAVRSWLRRNILPALIGAFMALIVVLAAYIVSRRLVPDTAVQAPRAAPGFQELWIKEFQGNQGETNCEPTAMTTDAQGNIYITGFMQTEKYDVDYLTVKYDPKGIVLWYRQYDGLSHDVDRARSIALDNQGNVIVTGESDNGGGKGADRLKGLDFVTVKYSPEGNQLWAARYNGSADGKDVPVKVAVDPAGNSYVFGSAMLSHLASGWRSFGYVIIKYDPDGKELWRQEYSSKQDFYLTATDMALDKSGHVYVTGHAQLGHQFDWVTIRYSPNGSREWVQRYGDPSHGTDAARSIALDSLGDIYVVGETYKGDPANGGVGVDLLAIKYDSSSTEKWKLKSADQGLHFGSARQIAVYGQERVYVVGTARDVSSSIDIGLISLDVNGNELWRRTYNGLDSGEDDPRAMALDKAGNIFVTGVAFNGNPKENGNDFDYVTLQYNPHGDLLHRSIYNDASNGIDTPAAIATDPVGDAIVTGQANNKMVTIKYHP